jgi:zinc protease
MNTIANLGFEKVDEADGIVEYRCVANGLKVLLIENHAAPVVTSMIVYKVGSRNEAVGYTGSTHFLEHMMFKGTPTYNLVESLKPLGADFNATTSYDRTNYFAKVPSQYLRELITMEADRMRNLSLRQSDRDSEMTVVRNEFEISKNDPGSLLREHLMATAFREHPYHHPIIGWLDDVQNVPLARMKEFYDTFYWPNNATLMVTGDFDTVECLTIIGETYGQIPSAPHPIPQVYTSEPAQEGERRFKLVKASTKPAQVMIGFHIPSAMHEDSYALSALGRVLGNSGQRASRMYKALIETRLAVSCAAGSNASLDPGLFMLMATCAPGVKPEQVEAALLGVMASMATDLVSDDELNRVKAANRKGTALGSDNQMALLGQLCHAEVVGTWKEYIDYDNKFDEVTPEMVRAVAGRYFSEDNRTVGTFVPRVDAAENEESEALAADDAVVLHATGGSAAATEEKAVTFKSQTTDVTLANGLVVNVLPMQSAKTVAVSLKVRAGDCYAAAGKTLVPTIAAMLLNKGSKKASKATIAETLEEMSARMEFGSDTYNSNLSGKVVASDFSAYIALVADALANPLYNDSDLQQAKLQLHSYLRDAMSDTDELAGQKLAASLYGANAVHYSKPFEDVLDEVEHISIDDVRAFHAQYYIPKGAIISVAGGIEADEAVRLIQAAFADWKAPEGVEAAAIPVVPALVRESAEKHIVRVEDQTSVTIMIGLPSAIKFGREDFYAGKVANAALGESTLSSRLGDVLRKEHGLTYGIRSSFGNPMFGDGTWTISITVNPANVDKALGLIEEVVAKYVAEGINDREFDEAIKGAAGSFVVRLDSPSAIASTLNTYAFAGFGAELMDRQAANYQAVTREAVNAFIRANFDLSKAVTVVVGTV